MTNDSTDEIIAGFKKADLKKFHTGNFSGLVFPVPRLKIRESKACAIIVRVYAFSLTGKILLQRRSATKDLYPLHYCDSASGLVQYNDFFSFDYIQTEAWRELMEEMGVSVIYGRLYDINIENNRKQACELVYNFIALVSEPTSLDPIETASESGFFCLNAFQKMITQEKFVPITEKYWKQILFIKIYDQLLEEYEKESLSLPNNPKSLNSSLSDVGSNLYSSKSRNYSHSIHETANNRRGAIVGRFQPFHNGHLQLILAILTEVEIVKIGIGSSQYSHTIDNPFSFEERKQMIISSLNDLNVSSSRYEIHPIPDLHDIKRWSASLLAILGDFDIFYSNNSWVRQYLLNIHKQIGPILKFNFDQYNGSKIRNLIRQNKSIDNSIPSAVKSILLNIDGFNRIRAMIKDKF